MWHACRCQMVVCLTCYICICSDRDQLKIASTWGTLQIRIQLVRQRSDLTLEQTSKTNKDCKHCKSRATGFSPNLARTTSISVLLRGLIGRAFLYPLYLSREP